MDARLGRAAATRVGRALDPYLGISELRRINPALALIPMVVVFVMGLTRSTFGHIDTVPGVFPMMALISGLNPVAGLLSAAAYALADLAQKFVVDDVFYEGVRTAGDYWGARAGYVLAYPALLLFGVLPGALSRAGRRVAQRVTVDQRGGIGGPTVPVTAPPNLIAQLIGSVLGGVAGSAIAGVVWPGAIAPAFLFRPSPDHSCHALSIANAHGAIPPASIAASVGGGAVTAGPAVIPGLSPTPSPFGSTPLGAPLPPASPPVPAPAAAPAGPIETVVVSGPEAIDELVAAGYPTVTHGGKTFVRPPASPSGSIPGVAFGPPMTLPTGEVVVDPTTIAIVKEVPTLTGPTTTTAGGPAIDELVAAGFPTVPGPGGPLVRVPPNLIHGNVSGVSFGGTKTVDGVEVIDPTKGVVIQQTGDAPVTATAPGTTTSPAPPGGPTTPVPGGGGAPAATTDVPPPDAPPLEAPTGPPRTPGDAPSLKQSLGQPGTTIITPQTVPSLAPEALTPDGRIRFKNPAKVPDFFKKLDGKQAPTPTIQGGRISVDLPLSLGHVDVSISVQDGRMVADATPSGPLKAVEDASMVTGIGGVDVTRSVQDRLNPLNKAVQDAGLRVKSVTLDAGQISIVTGPR